MKHQSRRIDLIVAKYKEDTSWCHTFEKNCALWIYDKKDPHAKLSLPNIPKFSCPKFRGAFHAKTPTGRESHTYLYHILKHYPNFADFNLFCQGKVEDHVPLFNDVLDYLFALKEPPHFLHFGKPELNDATGATHHRGLPIDRIYRRLFKGDVPQQFLFQLSATFWVSRESILSRPKRFYEEMMQIVYDEPLSGYVFERLWGYVLHSPYLKCQNWQTDVDKSSWSLDL